MPGRPFIAICRLFFDCVPHRKCRPSASKLLEDGYFSKFAKEPEYVRVHLMDVLTPQHLAALPVAAPGDLVVGVTP